MPYKLIDLEHLAIHKKISEPQEILLEGGKDVSRRLSDKWQGFLDTTGGSSHGGDRSVQDSAVITAILNVGHSAADTYATFINSVRGKDAKERKAGHFDDYVRRTISKAAAFVKPEQSEAMEQIGGRILDLNFEGVPATLVVSNASRLLAHTFRGREPLMVNAQGEAILHRASINQIHASRGVGKTFFGLGLSAALAGGGEFLGWQSEGKHNVLYLDGELPGEELQERVRMIVGPLNRFHVITTEQQPDETFLSINSAEGRTLIEHAVISHRIEVLVLDSISTLANIATNDEEAWLDIVEWFRNLRTKHGIAVIYLHHDGKNGTQRGHSKHEDPLDKSIHLYWEGTYQGTDGLKCALKFDKARQPIREGNCLRIELAKDGRWRCSHVAVSEQRKRGRPLTENPIITKQLIEMAEQNMSAEKMSVKLKEEHGKDAPSLSTIKRRLRDPVNVEKSVKRVINP
jgi:hypothetical protein